MTREEELDLVHQAQSGKLEAFDALVREHEKIVYNLALRMTGKPEDAEDMAQEAFLRAYRALDLFRAESRFSVWLYRIVTNVCLDFHRREDRNPTESLIVETEEGETKEREIPDEEQAPETVLERKLTREAVQRGLNFLPSEQREILLLREIRGLSYEEIGMLLGLETGTVKSRIFRARKKLCGFLVREGNIPDYYASKRAEGGDLV